MIEKVLDTIKKHDLIQPGEDVVVGVSGGPDSVCLLHILSVLAVDFDIRLHAVHINHMIRGAEADSDEEYVRKLCTLLKIPLYAESADIPRIARQKGISLEEAGREERYRQFHVIAEKVGAVRIAVAHNKNDQAETVLMHIIRGTGIDGLKGMDYKKGRIIRPLLDAGRDEIEEYCAGYFLNPRTDSSNLENVYLRNRIRLDLIPYIDRLFGTGTIENICRMARLLSDDRDYLESKALALYESCILNKIKGEVRLDISKMNESHPSMVKRILRSAIKDVKGNLKGIESVHVDYAVELAGCGRTGAEICLPHNLRVCRLYDVLKVYEYKGVEKREFLDRRVEIPGTTLVKPKGPIIIACIEDRKDNMEKFHNIPCDSLFQFFDYRSLKMGINIRNRRSGDMFMPVKSNGTRKLKEYFIDCKIPRDERDRIPLIASGSEIVWIIGYKTSNRFKVTEDTDTIVKLEYIL